MNQTSPVGNKICFYLNDELKEDIFVILCHIHTVDKDKLQPFPLQLLRLDFSGYIFGEAFVYNF